MKYIRLKLNGFRPLMQHQYNKEPIEITNIDKYSVIGVFGGNATGKSSLLGEMSPFINPIMYVGKDAYKEIEFEYNKNIYVCILKPIQKHYQIFKNGVLVKDTQKGNITQYLQYINDYLNINKNIAYFFYIKGKSPGMPGMSPVERKRSFLDINPILEKINEMYLVNIKPTHNTMKHEMNSILQNLNKSRTLEKVETELNIAEASQEENDVNYTNIIKELANNNNAITLSKNSMDTRIKQGDIGSGYSDRYDIRVVKEKLIQAKNNYSTSNMEEVLKVIAKYTKTRDISVAINIIKTEVDELIPKLEVNEKLLKENDEKNLQVEIVNTKSSLNNIVSAKDVIVQDINAINSTMGISIPTLAKINITDCKLLVNDISRYFFTDINYDRIINIYNVDLNITKANIKNITLKLNNSISKQAKIIESKKIVDYLDGSECIDENCEYKKKVNNLKDTDNIDEKIDELRSQKSELELLVSNYEYSQGKLNIIEELVSRINSSRVLQLLNKYSNITKEFVYNMLEKSSFNDLVSYIENIKIFIKKIYDLKILLNDLLVMEDKIEILNNTLELLQKNMNSGMFNNIKQQHIVNKTRYKELSGDLELLTPVKENARKFNIITKKLDSVYLYENDILECQDTIRKSNRNIEDLNSKLDDLLSNKKTLGKSIDYLKIELHTIKSLADNMDNLKRDLDVYRQLDNLFDPKKGISVSILKKLASSLKDLTNDILQKILNGDSQIEIGITVDDVKFNIEVFKNDVYQGDARNAASDGETDLIKLAIHLAFCLLLKQNKTYLNVLILDEIDAYLDVSMNKARFANLIPYLTNVLKFNQIFLVSHNNHLLTDKLGLILLPNYSIDNLNENNIIYELKGKR